MILNLFDTNSNFFHKRLYRGFIYFLTLMALAMPLINQVIILLPVIFMTIISFYIAISESITGYIAVALSVCKNE